MASTSFLGSKINCYIISHEQYNELIQKTGNISNVLNNVKGLPFNSLIFVNIGSAYKLFVTDNEGIPLPVTV